MRTYVKTGGEILRCWKEARGAELVVMIIFNCAFFVDVSLKSVQLDRVQLHNFYYKQ